MKGEQNNAVLSDAGYLERHSGKGTFVTEKKMQRSINQVLGFTEMCKILNTTAGAKTLKIALEDPTEKEAEQLLIQPSNYNRYKHYYYICNLFHFASSNLYLKKFYTKNLNLSPMHNCIDKAQSTNYIIRAFKILR